MKIEELHIIKPKHKYHAQKMGGYDSKKEFYHAEKLKLLQKNGIISDLKEQVPFILAPVQKGIDYKGKEIVLRRELSYIADFTYTQQGQSIVCDVKGFKTKEYTKKKNLLKKVYGIEILEV